jgi:hypothetical protein
MLSWLLKEERSLKMKSRKEDIEIQRRHRNGNKQHLKQRTANEFHLTKPVKFNSEIFAFIKISIRTHFSHFFLTELVFSLKTNVLHKHWAERISIRSKNAFCKPSWCEGRKLESQDSKICCKVICQQEHFYLHRSKIVEFSDVKNTS